MLLLILFVLFFIVIQNRPVKISADELIKSYSSNYIEADKKFLRKELEISGKVKSFLQLVSDSMLVLQSSIQNIKLYCKLNDEETIKIAESLTLGTTVSITGKCLGIKPELSDASSNIIYIEAKIIK